jgi:tetratricopeptide (TPR) repeat protein
MQATSSNHSENLVDGFAARRAKALLNEGVMAGADGQFEKAIRLFKSSQRLQKSAEALTYWGWAEATKGNLHVAIHLCREALRLDSEFGNASNDIGSYLVALRDEASAIPYFERAKTAKNYATRHFPMVNLGRLYWERGSYWKAYKEYTEAQAICPDDQSIKKAMAELRNRIM